MFALLEAKRSGFLGREHWLKNIVAAGRNQAAADKNNYLQNEFLELITRAEKIYYVKKKKRR